MHTRRPVTSEPDAYILIVDDELTVLEVTRTMATSLGWKPLLSNTSEHALEMFREHSGAIGHVLIDLHMPGMDGGTLAHAMRDIRDDVHIDVMTGDESAAEPLLGPDGAIDGVLIKPFALTDLAHALEPQARAA